MSNVLLKLNTLIVTNNLVRDYYNQKIIVVKLLNLIEILTKHFQNLIVNYRYYKINYILSVFDLYIKS